MSNIKETIFEKIAKMQERERERKKTRAEKRREKKEFDYVFNGGKL